MTTYLQQPRLEDPTRLSQSTPSVELNPDTGQLPDNSSAANGVAFYLLVLLLLAALVAPIVALVAVALRRWRLAIWSGVAFGAALVLALFVGLLSLLV